MTRRRNRMTDALLGLLARHGPLPPDTSATPNLNKHFPSRPTGMAEVKDRRIIIYPDYINSVKTVAQGRRIPADKCVEWPTLPEMQDVCIKALRLQAEIEMKRYPRNWCVELGHEYSYGRLRVALKNPDGSPVNPDVPNRRELMLKLGEFVAKHPNRHKKAGGKGDAGAGSSSSAAGSKQSSKKSGKKKR